MLCCRSSNCAASSAASAATAAAASVFRCAVVLLLVALSSSAGQSNNASCPSEVSGHKVVFGGLCYQFVNVEKTWLNARAHCRQQSRVSPGRLVNVPDAATQSWLVAQMSVARWTRNNGVWLGLHDRDNEQHFVWDQYDGRDTPATYTNWASGEPDNSRNQNCVYMRRQYGWKWVDVECNLSPFRTYFFICQYRLIGGSEATTPRATTTAGTSTYAPTSSALATTLRLLSNVRSTYTTKVLASPTPASGATGLPPSRFLEQSTSMQPLRTETRARPVFVYGSSVTTTRPLFVSAASATTTQLPFRTVNSVVAAQPVTGITSSVTPTRPVSGTPVWATSKRPIAATTTPTTRPVFRTTISANSTQPLFWWVASASSRWPIFWSFPRTSTALPFYRQATSAANNNWTVFRTDPRASITPPFYRPTTSGSSRWSVFWTDPRASTTPPFYRPPTSVTDTWPIFWINRSASTAPPFYRPATSVATSNRPVFRTDPRASSTPPFSRSTTSVTTTNWPVFWIAHGASNTPPFLRSTTSATTTNGPVFWIGHRASNAPPFYRPATSATSRRSVFWTAHRASTTPPFYRPPISVASTWPIFWINRSASTAPFYRPATSVATSNLPVFRTDPRASSTPPFSRSATSASTTWPVFRTDRRASSTPQFFRQSTPASTTLSLLKDAAASVAVAQRRLDASSSSAATRPAYSTTNSADPKQAADHEQRSITTPLPLYNNSHLPTDHTLETSAIQIAENLSSLFFASSVPPATADGLHFGAAITTDLMQAMVHENYTTLEPSQWLSEDDLHTDYDFASGRELSTGQANGIGCPSDVQGRTVVYGGLCYQFVPVEKTWVNARLHCRQQSRLSPGRLVNVPDAAAQRWLVAQMTIAGWTRNNGVWLGLHDRDNELHFVWDQYDGQDTPSGYTNWATGEPDNSRNQNCVYMRRQFGWRWADVECHSPLFRTYFFICQYRLVAIASTTIRSRAATSTSSSPSHYSTLTSAASARSTGTNELRETPKTSSSFSTFGARMMETSPDSDNEFTKLSSSSTASNVAAESLAATIERVTTKIVPTSENATETPTTSLQDQTTEGARDSAARLSSINDGRLVTHYNFETSGLLTDPISVRSETTTSPHIISETSRSVEQEMYDLTLSSRSSSKAPLAEASYANDVSLRNTTERSSYSPYFTAAGASNGVASTAASVPPAHRAETAELRTTNDAVLTSVVTLASTLWSKGNGSASLESSIEFSHSSTTSSGVGLYVGVSVGAAILLIGAMIAIALTKRTKMLQGSSRQNLVLRPVGVENPVYSAADHSESATFYRHSIGPAEVCSTICSPDSELRFPLLKQVGRC